MRTSSVLILLLTLSFSTLANAEMWQLINSQFSGTRWYCTYKLQSTNVQTTITSSTVCQPYIFQ